MNAYLVPAVDGVAYGLLLFVVAAGMALAFGVGQTLNLAHGLLYALGAYTAAAISDGSWLMLCAALAVGTLVAAAAGGLVAAAVHPVVHRGFLTQALLTFGLALIGGDLLVAGFGATDLPVRVPSTVDSPVHLLGHDYPGYRLLFVVVGLALAAGLHHAVTRTRAGMLVRALADDRAMVSCLGVSPLRVRAGALAAAGGL
ncbi:MAG TPA: branched-chain amino acid ABC transporter permease, partial [Rugosimonospora sp.]|nr:branched-chain amino acid ABC transporter permease [Rugosimonospora sp.]